MAATYKYSKEACAVARKLLQTTRHVSKFIRTFHQIRHKLNFPTNRLEQVKNQLNKTTKITAEMCMTKHPLINSTHVGETNNAGVINNWSVVSTHTDQYGAVHHSTTPSLYIFAVLIMIAIFLALLIWFCKGSVWDWFTNLFQRNHHQPQQQQISQTMGLQNLPQIVPQHIVNLAQAANRGGSGYFQRTMPTVIPEIH